MNETPTALKLAEYHECAEDLCSIQTAAELRRLYSENQRLAAEVANRNRRALDGDMAVVALENTHAYYEGLEAQRDQLLEAYRKMKNVAAAYSNFCDDSAFTRKLEREFDAADAIVRAAIAKATGGDARCPLCRYEHGHAIGCNNNPVDKALAAMTKAEGLEP